MKKILFSMLLLIPFLSGCASVDTKITINNDRSASIATSVSYQGDLSDKKDANAVLISENYSRYTDNGYQVDKAYNSKLSTIIATKKVKDLNLNDLDLSSLGFVSNLSDKRFIGYKKSFMVKSFNIDLTYDYTAEAKKYSNSAVEKTGQSSNNQKGLSPEYYQKYLDEVDAVTDEIDISENIEETVTQAKNEQTTDDKKEVSNTNETTPLSASISIQLPAPAFYNNADEVKGTLYTWNIKQDKPTHIKLQYVQYSGFAIAIVILIGILLLILGAKKIIKHENQKRIGSSENLIP